MSRENRFLKKGGGFLRKEKKKGFISLGINKLKLIREKQKKKIEIERELKIINLNCDSLRLRFDHKFGK